MHASLLDSKQAPFLQAENNNLYLNSAHSLETDGNMRNNSVLAHQVENAILQALRESDYQQMIIEELRQV